MNPGAFEFSPCELEPFRHSCNLDMAWHRWKLQVEFSLQKMLVQHLGLMVKRMAIHAARILLQVGPQRQLIRCESLQSGDSSEIFTTMNRIILFLATLCPLLAFAVAPQKPFELRGGDRLVFLGDTLKEREKRGDAGGHFAREFRLTQGRGGNLPRAHGSD